MRDGKAGKYAAADDTDAWVDKAADGELSEAELSDVGGGRLALQKKPDEDAGADGRGRF